MEISNVAPDDFIDGLEDADVAQTLRELDTIIVGAMPGRRRVLWQGVFWGGTQQSIIGYGDIRQPRPRGEEVNWFLVGLARQKSNYSLYVNATENGRYLGQVYGADLGKVKLGSGSIGFRRLADLDPEALRNLLTKAHELTPADPTT